jgi:hypothetical protein
MARICQLTVCGFGLVGLNFNPPPPFGTLTDDGEKDNQLMASNGWSKQPYTGFGIHTQWYKKDIVE